MIKLGADPEWFLTDGKKVISAIGKVGGTKRKPRPLNDLVQVQEDNVAVEYNIIPCQSKYEWNDVHMVAARLIKEEVKPKGLKPLIKASHSFDDTELDDPRAWVFGCEPDFNVWSLKINPKPHSNDTNLRSAGGHIHIGYDNPTKVKSIEYARCMDLFVGLPLMCVDPDAHRMELYGKAGAIRFKPYGLEYRTPSNFWTISKELIEWTYKNSIYAMGFLKEVPDEVEKVINSRDKEAAKDLMKLYGVVECSI